MRNRASFKDLALISGNIAKLYEEGIPILNVLSLMDELPLRKDYNSLLKTMRKMIEKGSGLEEAFSSNKKLVPKFFVSMISIGEKTGKIIYVLKGLEIYYGKLQYMKKLIISSLTYPAILIVTLIFLGFFVLLFFIPSMTGIYESMGKEIPSKFQSIVSFKESFIDSPVIMIINIIIWVGVIPCIVIKKYLLKYIMKGLSKFNIYRKINEYIAIVLISVVVNSGINISLGISYCCEEKIFGNVNEGLRIINKEITFGNGLWQAMKKTNMFSKYTLAHIKLGEESGTLDRRLMTLEKEQFELVTENINRKMQLIQPMLILFIGALISTFIIIFILPLLDSVLIG